GPLHHVEGSVVPLGHRRARDRRVAEIETDAEERHHHFLARPHDKRRSSRFSAPFTPRPPPCPSAFSQWFVAQSATNHCEKLKKARGAVRTMASREDRCSAAVCGRIT